MRVKWCVQYGEVHCVDSNDVCAIHLQPGRALSATAQVVYAGEVMAM